MRPIQQSLLGQQESFLPIPIPQDHEMVILSKTLDWDLLQVIAEECRRGVVSSTRGQVPHYRALNGAIVVKALRGSTYRDTEDLIRNYLPARYLCDLHNSLWTPGHVAIFEYEGMLGERGMTEITDYVLRTARDVGFADPSGLCTDTTAQEGDIPYPTEVGHMNSFMKSVRDNLGTLAKNSVGLGKKVSGKMFELFSKVGKQVREYRLFSKTKEAKQKVLREVEVLSRRILNDLGELLSDIDLTGNQVRGMGKRALNNLAENYQNMCQMLPQISQWIATGKVARGKIISLFNTELRSIPRGKVGKSIEFGLKWGINQIRGGYVSLFMHSQMMSHDTSYMVMGVEEHIRIFGEPPKDFGFDRSGWSHDHMRDIKKLGVRNLAVAPKGRAEWSVGLRVKDKMVRERAHVEGKIGTMKRNGLNRPSARTSVRVRISALRAGLCLNLRRFAKDLVSAEMGSLQPINA